MLVLQFYDSHTVNLIPVVVSVMIVVVVVINIFLTLLQLCCCSLVYCCYEFKRRACFDMACRGVVSHGEVWRGVA